MDSATLTKMDSNYTLLENVTNKKYAKKILTGFLVGFKVDKNYKETDYDTIFDGILKVDMTAEIAKYALVCSCQQNEELRYPSFVELKEQLINNGIDVDGVVDYLYDNKCLFIRVISDFVDLRYNSKERVHIDYNVNDDYVKKFISHIESNDDYEDKHSIVGKISNILFNRSRNDVISNSQMKINRRKYSLGSNLFAYTDKGESPFRQEDAVLLLKHPDNKNFKMIAVADGDGSKIGGYEASNFALRRLLKWFESKGAHYFYKVEMMKESLVSELNKINDSLTNDHYSGATTVAIAIIGEKDTLISTVGDSKILLVKNNKIVDETKDDSYVQRLCDNGLADPKMAKFHKAIDCLMNELGATSEKEVISNNIRVLSNDYDKILILTDGVTRLVNNDKIEKILKNNKDGKIVSELVRTAKEEDVYSEEIDQFSEKVIKANQNNMTAAMYIKRR